MSKNRTIYFPRMNQYWEKTEMISLNAYMNMFRYVKADISDELLSITMGGEIPFIKDGKFVAKRINPEKSISYVLGLYYEEFLHDYKEEFLCSVIKNLKMRIAVPIIMLKQGVLQEENEIPALCCGYDNEKGSLIIVDPSTGEYSDIELEDLSSKNGQKKMFMLNVPGMIQMKCLEHNSMFNQAISMYITRFYNLSTSNDMEKMGFKAMQWMLENNLTKSNEESMKSHINTQKSWFLIVQKYKSILKDNEKHQIDNIEKFYNSIVF